VWSGSTNHGLAGATVTVSGTMASGSGFSQSVVTESDGRWVIDLPYGSYTIIFSAQGYQSQTWQNWVWNADIGYSGGTLTLQPTASATLTSRLFYGFVWNDILNQGLLGATVTVSGSTTSGSSFSQSVVTGTDGMWNIVLPWGSYTVTVSAPGYQTQSFQINGWSPDIAYSGGAVHLQLLTTTVSSSTSSSTSATLTSRLFYGTVWNPVANQPLAGATVTVSGSTASGSAFTQSMVTGSDGRWEIQLPWGTSYTFTVSALGYQSQSIQLGSWTPDTSYSGGVVTLQPTASWTFMVYIDGDNNLEGGKELDLSQMESVGSNTQVSIVALFDRKSTNDAMVYYVQNGAATQVDWGSTDMGNPATLMKFIVYAGSHYPAQHYALILSNHGGGIEGAMWDDTSSHHLTVAGLTSALAGSGIRFNVVGFDACLMSMVEVAYQLRSYSDYLVSSEEVTYLHEFHYDIILSSLVNNPQMSGRDLASILVTYCHGDNADGTFSAIDLSRIDNVASSVNGLAGALKSGLSLYGNQIANARTSSEHYYFSNYIDVYDFAYLLSQDQSIGANIKNAALDVTHAIDNAVISNWHGAIHTRSHGLSIYFDTSKSSYQNMLQNIAPDYGSLDFCVSTGWRGFVEAYLQVDGTP